MNLSKIKLHLVILDVNLIRLVFMLFGAAVLNFFIIVICSFQVANVILLGAVDLEVMNSGDRGPTAHKAVDDCSLCTEFLTLIFIAFLSVSIPHAF